MFLLCTVNDTEGWILEREKNKTLFLIFLVFVLLHEMRMWQFSSILNGYPFLPALSFPCGIDKISLFLFETLSNALIF